MSVVRVWAPNASRVDLVIGSQPDERRPMKPAAASESARGGWWEIQAPELEPEPGEVDYAFSLDGGPPRLDPRAQRLPNGVHGPGRLVDHGAFHWTDEGWQAPRLSEAVFYELHVGTFSTEGTFDGVVEHLDHLVDLGITHVELMPVHSFPGRYGWGYDSAGLFAPHEPYGGPDGLKRLVDAAHGRGLAVALDVVYNHFGPEGNYLDEFGPYRTDRFQTPWGPAVNLGDRGSDEVRAFLIDNALAWFRDYHVDVLRLDAVHALIDLTACHFLEELADAVTELGRQTGRELCLVAESDLNDPRLLRAPKRGGYGLDAQWSDDFHHAIHVALTGERDGYYSDFEGLPDVAAALERTWVYDGRYSPFRGRRHGRPAADLSPNRFLGYMQNHDQVGNRARGERISMLTDAWHQRVGAAVVMTAPFIPLVFAGEEWAASTPFPFFADYGDPGLREAVRRGRREEFESFGWDPDQLPDPVDEATFESARLDWSEIDEPAHADMLGWYRELIELRRQQPVLSSGSPSTVLLDRDRKTLTASYPGLGLLVNLGDSSASFDLGDRRPERLLASRPGVRDERGRLEIPPMSAAVVVF